MVPVCITIRFTLLAMSMLLVFVSQRWGACSAISCMWAPIGMLIWLQLLLMRKLGNGGQSVIHGEPTSYVLFLKDPVIEVHLAICMYNSTAACNIELPFH